MTVSERTELFISVAEDIMFAIEYMLYFKQLCFHLNVFLKKKKKNNRKMECKGQQGKICKALLHSFFLFLFPFCIINVEVKGKPRLGLMYIIK